MTAITEINKKALQNDQAQRRAEIEKKVSLEMFIEESLNNIEELTILLAIKGLETVSISKNPLAFFATDHELIHDHAKKILDALFLDYTITSGDYIQTCTKSEYINNYYEDVDINVTFTAKYVFTLNSSNLKKGNETEETRKLSQLMDKLYTIYTKYPFIFYKMKDFSNKVYYLDFLKTELDSNFSYSDPFYVDHTIAQYKTTESIVNKFSFMFSDNYQESENKLDKVSIEVAKFIYSINDSSYKTDVNSISDASALYASLVMLDIKFDVTSYVTHKVHYFEQDGYCTSGGVYIENYFDIHKSSKVKHTSQDIEKAKKVLEATGTNPDTFKEAVELELQILHATNGYGGKVTQSGGLKPLPNFGCTSKSNIPTFKILEKNQKDAKKKKSKQKTLQREDFEVVEITLGIIKRSGSNKSYSDGINLNKVLMFIGIFLALIMASPYYLPYIFSIL